MFAGPENDIAVIDEPGFSPQKADVSDILLGTNDSKVVTPKGLKDSNIIPMPSTPYVEVNTFADLPLTIGNPAVGIIYVVNNSSGIWFINRKVAGMYRRITNNGNSSDWERFGVYDDVFTSLPLVKADADVADAIAKKHASGSDNQDLSSLAPINNPHFIGKGSVQSATPYLNFVVKNDTNNVLGGFGLIDYNSNQTYAIFTAYNLFYIGFASTASGADAAADFSFNTIFKSTGVLLLGTASADGSYSITFGGESNQSIGMNRRAVAGAGKNLTIIGCGAKSGENNTAAGIVEIDTGLATGNQAGTFVIKVSPVGASGVQDNSLIEIIKAIGNTLGFFGVTPVARQLVPTGSTADNIITALQNLGLFKQS